MQATDDAHLVTVNFDSRGLPRMERGQVSSRAPTGLPHTDGVQHSLDHTFDVSELAHRRAAEPPCRDLARDHRCQSQPLVERVAAPENLAEAEQRCVGGTLIQVIAYRTDQTGAQAESHLWLILGNRV